MGRARSVVVAAIVLLCVLLAVPVFAFVSHSVHTVRIPQYAFAYDYRSARTGCPSAQQVQFGGFAIDRPRVMSVRGMRRSADSQWTVDGYIGPSGQRQPSTGKVTSIAYCGNGPVPQKVTRSKRIDGSGGVTASCPAGTVVLAGGFATSPQSTVGIDDLERIAADQWRVRVQSGEPTILTAIAYCEKGPPPKLVSSRIAINAREQQTTHATCPAGKSLVFGGVIAMPTSNPSVPGNFAFVSTVKAPSATSWSVTGGMGGTNPSDGYLTALAYCR